MTNQKSSAVSRGAPTKYDPKYCQEIIEYFDVRHYDKAEKEPADFPQFTAFAKKIGVTRSTLFKWTNDYPEFSDAYKCAKELQEELLVNNSLKNRYNPYFAQFVLKNGHGWRDKQEIEQTNEIKVEITKDEQGL